jgi:biotin synthase
VDILAFRGLDLDMIGVGPFLRHPETPLGEQVHSMAELECGQVPNTVTMTCKVVALARLVCPEANIPSTTALATLDRAEGREKGLACGANVVMPNLTPTKYRALYEIYPDKACIFECASVCAQCLKDRLAAIGRGVGMGQGGRHRG